MILLFWSDSCLNPIVNLWMSYFCVRFRSFVASLNKNDTIFSALETHKFSYAFIKEKNTYTQFAMPTNSLSKTSGLPESFWNHKADTGQLYGNHRRLTSYVTQFELTLYAPPLGKLNTHKWLSWIDRFVVELQRWHFLLEMDCTFQTCTLSGHFLFCYQKI